MLLLSFALSLALIGQAAGAIRKFIDLLTFLMALIGQTADAISKYTDI